MSSFASYSTMQAGGPIPSQPRGITFEDDFLAINKSATADLATYHLQSPQGSSTFAGLDNTYGGWGNFSLSSGAGDNSNISLNGEPFQTGTDRAMTFYARFKVEDADEDKFWIGVHENSTLTTGSVLAESTFDGIGFYTSHAAAGTPTLRYACGNGTNNTTGSTGVTMADDTVVEVAFVVDRRNQVEFFVNGSSVAKVTTYIPTNTMTLIFQAWALDGGTDDVSIDYWRVTQDRI